MKKTLLFVAFLLLGFVGFGQSRNPYIIKYRTQDSTVCRNTQSVNGIHVDAFGHELIHEDGTDWTPLADLDTVYIYREEKVNPNYVPIDWDNTTLVSGDTTTGNYQIHFGGELPELFPGSVIAIDQDTVVRYIFIESVDVAGNTVNLTSTEAYLTDIFADTDFTLTTADEGKGPKDGNVFYPVAAYQLNEHGVYEPLDLSRLRDDGWGFTHDLWEFGENFNGEVLFSGSNFSVYMERLNFNFDLDIDLHLNFSGRDVHEIVGNAIDRYRSRALNVNASLVGTFDTEQRVRCDVTGSCGFNPDYDIWKPNMFRPVTARFLVYGVPISIKLNSDLYRQVALNASGEISAYTGFSDIAQGRVGFEWRQAGGISPVASFSNTFDYTPPTVEGKGTVAAKVWAIPRIRLIIEDLFGPSFDIKPFLSDTLRGGFKEELLGQGNDFCAWSLDCNTGLDACCGLSLQFMGYEVENISTPTWNIVARPLYHSPQRIEYNGSKGTEIRIGQRNTIGFTIYDRNHLFNTDVITPLPQFVKFEGDGEISSEYGIAHNGTATVEWTPAADQDVLRAILYDINGTVLAEDEVTAEITVTTSAVNGITQTAAIGGGNIVGNGFVEVTERGICWSTYTNPTVNGNHAANGSGTGQFTVSMNNLTAGTTYHVRAYAMVGGEPVYGNEVSFATEASYTISTSSNPSNGGSTTGGGTYNQGATCTLTAIANNGYTFQRWTRNGTQVSTSATYSFTVTESANFVAVFEAEPQGDWVDLGLPSGLLWATRNVGASSPEDYGDYFAWAETQPKSYYDWDTYTYTCGDYYDMTKYCNYSGYGCNGYADNLTILQAGDDAATAKWGSGWRTPTEEEWRELLDHCTSVWTTQNGVRGRRFTGSNGNTLFLPAAGCRWDGNLNNAGRDGDYWSSSLYLDILYCARRCYFNSGYCNMSHDDRYGGHSVRAVRSAR